ncbi:PREDICTED: uncharacterized protein LOC109234560 [Nicotiana attenuata]|uniref:uncharacterized protein LOC109234560 n=1 Tax=Nicotiana attenuata TaxID=49451 RepID=UPI000905929D|nr:PREDICTED: uncharacterized protein LOC109234560 [Nicotiana attenuata]
MDIVEEEVVENPENCAISLQALNGTLGFKTLRLRGFTEQKPLEMLIDCGSHITLWMRKQQKDQTGKSDIVLGIQWLCPLEDIKFNFRKLMMEFEYQGKVLTLQGIQPKFKTLQAKSLESMTLMDSQFFMVKVKDKEQEIVSTEEGEPAEVQGRQLLAKGSKWVFAAKRIEYLGYYIPAEGVSTDPHKIEAVKSWPKPGYVKQLKGFLGMADYYKRFIKGHGVISKPLTDFLKKDNFNWNEKT